jgi:hypothetical protein
MNIDIQRKKLELKRVRMAQEEMEFNVLERKADIERLTALIEKQEEKAIELEETIKTMEGK